MVAPPQAVGRELWVLAVLGLLLFVLWLASVVWLRLFRRAFWLLMAGAVQPAVAYDVLWIAYRLAGEQCPGGLPASALTYFGAVEQVMALFVALGVALALGLRRHGCEQLHEEIALATVATAGGAVAGLFGLVVPVVDALSGSALLGAECSYGGAAAVYYACAAGFSLLAALLLAASATQTFCCAKAVASRRPAPAHRPPAGLMLLAAVVWNACVAAQALLVLSAQLAYALGATPPAGLAWAIETVSNSTLAVTFAVLLPVGFLARETTRPTRPRGQRHGYRRLA